MNKSCLDALEAAQFDGVFKLLGNQKGTYIMYIEILMNRMQWLPRLFCLFIKVETSTLNLLVAGPLLDSLLSQMNNIYVPAILQHLVQKGTKHYEFQGLLSHLR